MNRLRAIGNFGYNPAPPALFEEFKHGQEVRGLRQDAGVRTSDQPRPQREQPALDAEPAARARENRNQGAADERLHAMSAVGKDQESGAISRF